MIALSHTRLDKATFEQGVPIVQTGAYGKALGAIDVSFDGGKPVFDYRLVDAKLAEKLATLTAPLPLEGIRKAATPLGRFLTESVRTVHGVDVGLFSSSQIGAGFPVGDVFEKDVYTAIGAYTR